MKKKRIRVPVPNRVLLKLWKIMRFSVFFLLLFVAQTFATVTYSQQTRLTLKMQGAKVIDILSRIEDESEFFFLFNQKLVDVDRQLNLDVKNERVDKILAEIFDDTNVSYLVRDRQIILTTEQNNSGLNVQQQKSISGKVTDSNGGPIPGVSVIIKGTTIGTITDIEGNFTIANIPENASLQFSFIGMTSQEVTVANKTSISVTLEDEAYGIDEVVAIGYGTQKRANIVGAVASVDGEQLQAIPAMNVSNAISGLIPGTTIIQQTGEPGQGSPRIMIRGRSTVNSDGSRMSNNSETAPLVVIDGVPGRSMDEIDPADVASLSVLKDASAAIYGAQAANGVILITTKSGKDGKPRLNYQFYEGVMTPTVLPGVTNAADYATMLSEYQVAEGKSRRYTDADIELFRNGKDPWEHPNTDWYGDLIKNWTTTTRHNITLDGGHNGMNYYVSFGYKTDDAMYKASSTKYKQYNVRTKLEMPITNWLKTGVELAGFLTDRQYPYKSADAIVGQSTRLVPTNWSFWPTGEPGPDIEYGDNPVETSTFSAGKNDQKTYRLLSSFNATIILPIKGLSLSGRYSYDITNYYNKQFCQPWTLYYPNWDQATRGSDGFITAMPLTPTLRGLSSAENREQYDRTINQTGMVNFDYNRTFGDHTLTLFAGFEQYQTNYNYFYAYRKYYISSVIQTMDAGNAKDQNITGTASIYARKSYIGRASYDYKGKYLAEFVFRADGSLKFPSSNRFGYFPALMVGWRASEEDFWKANLSFVNYFKLRASVGKMGNDPGASFQYMDKYGIGTGMTFGTSGAIQTVVGPPTVANPFITWEKQTSYNVGFDSKFADNLFSLNAEFFYQRREDILFAKDASVPSFTGLSLPQENIGIVDNRGLELELGFHKALNNDFRIDATANISYNHNEVVFQDEPKRAVPWQQLTGHSYLAWLMYDAIGIYKDDAQVAATPHVTGAQAGDVIFRDVSGDGEITACLLYTSDAA